LDAIFKLFSHKSNECNHRKFKQLMLILLNEQELKMFITMSVRLFLTKIIALFQTKHALLIRSSVEYYDQTAYVSLIYKDGQRTLKATEIKSFDFNQKDDCYLLSISENQGNETKRLSKNCKNQIDELKLLLDDIIYE